MIFNADKAIFAGDNNTVFLPIFPLHHYYFMRLLIAGFFLIVYSVTYSQKSFTEVSKQAGIDHPFTVYQGSFGGGAVAFDYNNDGYEDIFIVGGTSSDALYLNKGDGTFENVYEKSGLKTEIEYVTLGAVSADVNKDGWRDLFVCTINSSANTEKFPRAPNILYINNGDGTFRDATAEYGLDKHYSFTTAAMFGDVNNDGYPDIYVGNYFKEFGGTLNLLDDAAIVKSNQSSEGNLFINKGGKYFKDEYEEYGLIHRGYGFGGAFTDYDNDGDLDLIVNHDFGYKTTPNFFYENKYPKKKFENASNKLKMSLPMNAMGTAIGDYNNDGFLDYYITNIKAGFFMVNQGPGKPLLNLNEKAGVRIHRILDSLGSYTPVSWGTNFADFDHDGDLDLFVANGCLNPYVEPNPNFYFKNINGKYTNVAVLENVADRGIGRGSITFDYDNDGDLDILVVNQDPVGILPEATRTLLYRNDSATGNWVKIALYGVDQDKNGIGSRIEISVKNKKYIREIDGGSSHSSQNSVIAHFGLGNIDIIDTIRVKWLGGKEQLLLNQKANRLIEITEDNNGRLSTVSWLWWLLVIPVGGAIWFYFRGK